MRTVNDYLAEKRADKRRRLVVFGLTCFVAGMAFMAAFILL
jgi:hypothetical protein